MLAHLLPAGETERLREFTGYPLVATHGLKLERMDDIWKV